MKTMRILPPTSSPILLVVPFSRPSLSASSLILSAVSILPVSHYVNGNRRPIISFCQQSHSATSLILPALPVTLFLRIAYSFSSDYLLHFSAEFHRSDHFQFRGVFIVCISSCRSPRSPQVPVALSFLMLIRYCLTLPPPTTRNTDRATVTFRFFKDTAVSPPPRMVGCGNLPFRKAMGWNLLDDS